MRFKNEKNGDICSHCEFVYYVWEETERFFCETHEDAYWCDLNKSEQIILYCQQFEHQLENMGWRMID